MSDIQKIRTLTGHSIRDFAYLVGVPHSTLEKAEQGRGNIAFTAMEIISDLADFVPGKGKLSSTCRQNLVNLLIEERAELIESFNARQRRYKSDVKKWGAARIDREITFHITHKSRSYSKRDDRRIQSLNRRSRNDTTPEMMLKVIKNAIRLKGITREIQAYNVVIRWFTRHSRFPKLENC